MASLRLYKKERLCSLTAINALFSPSTAGEGETFNVIVYPWRAVWRRDADRVPSCARFVISVPKKRLKHAVDRVLMRRRLREAYRLHRGLLPEKSGVDIAFVYVGNGLSDYVHSERSLKKILGRVSERLCRETTDGNDESV